MASDAKKLGVKIGKSEVYATAKGLRLGATGKIFYPKLFFSILASDARLADIGLPSGVTAKGVRRKIRKSLNKLGRRDLTDKSF